jgi:hypothetical protein
MECDTTVESIRDCVRRGALLDFLEFDDTVAIVIRVMRRYNALSDSPHRTPAEDHELEDMKRRIMLIADAIYK